MTRVKICGITTIEDALAAAEAGADMLGLNFYSASPRHIAIDEARLLCAQVRHELGDASPLLIGLFVNEPVWTISSTMERVGLRAVQLSGDESVDVLRELRGTAYKAVRPQTMEQLSDDITYFAPGFPTDDHLPSLLVDAYHASLYGGTGQQADTGIALTAAAHVPRLMLAGGLTHENVGDRVQRVRPWAVDVASGVEIPGQPGRKDPQRMKDFIAAVRQPETE